MLKSCSRCGKIHDSNYVCRAGKVWKRYDQEQRKLRSTNAWKDKSLEIRERANYLCEVCRDQGVFTYDGLEVHHIVKVKDDQSNLLNNFNLICLCVRHHKEADSGELDADYLRKLASIREEKESPYPN